MCLVSESGIVVSANFSKLIESFSLSCVLLIMHIKKIICFVGFG